MAFKAPSRHAPFREDRDGVAGIRCVLGDREAKDAGAAWYAFVFEPAVGGPGQAPAAMAIIRLEPQDDLPSGIVGLVHAGLLERWWGTRSVPPIEPGSYFATATMEALIAAAARTESGSPADLLRAEAQVQALVCEAMDAWRSGALVARAGDVSLHFAERERLTKARKLIETQFASKLTIEDLARACGLGRARLIRGFRLLYGQTIAECLSERRLQAAADALLATREPVSQIAFQSGYHSNAAFTRAFARRFGTVPTMFRAGPIAA